MVLENHRCTTQHSRVCLGWWISQIKHSFLAHILYRITYVTMATPEGIPPLVVQSVWDQVPPSTVYPPGCLLWQESVLWRGKPGTISPPRLKKFWSTPAPTEKWGAAKNTWPVANTCTLACRRPCLRDSVDVKVDGLLLLLRLFQVWHFNKTLCRNECSHGDETCC